MFLLAVAVAQLNFINLATEYNISRPGVEVTVSSAGLQDLPVFRVGGSLQLDCCSKFSHYGRDMLASYKAVVQYVNEVRGGLLVDGQRYRVEAKFLNDYGQKALTTKNTQWLVDNGYEFITCPYGSGQSKMVTDVTGTNTLTVCTCSSSGSVYLERPYAFGTLAPSTQFPVTSIRLFHEVDPTHTKYVIMHETKSFTKGVAKGATAEIESLGMEVLFTFEIPADATMGDIAAEIERWGMDTEKVEDRPIIIGAVYGNFCRMILTAMRQLNFKVKAALFSICVTEASFPGDIEAGSDLGNYVSGINLWYEGQEGGDAWSGATAMEYYNMMEKEMGLPMPYQAASTFGGLFTMLWAVEKAGINGTAVRDALDDLKNTGGLPTVYGVVSFDANGQLAADAVTTLQVQMTASGPIKKKVSAANFVYPIPYCTALEAIDVTTHTCKPLVCPPGFKGSGGVCDKCPPGFFSAEEGSLMCDACPLGTYQDQEGATECTACAVGTAQPKPGSTSCQLCSAGTFAAVTGAEICSPCPLGQHQALEGQDSCADCKATFVTASLGATHTSDCVCAPGKYWNRRDNQCDSCPPETFCAGGWSLPLVYEGNYLLYTGSVDDATLGKQEEDRLAGTYTPTEGAFSGVEVYKCSQIKQCPGKEMEVGTFGFAIESTLTKDHLRPGFPLPEACPEGRVGIACARCEEEYFGNKACNSCDGTMGLNIFGFLMGPFLMLLCYHVTKPTPGRARLLNAFILASLCGILVFFVQSLAVLGSVDIGWPDQLEAIFAFSRLFLFDFSGLTYACWTGNSFAARYLSSLLAPLMMAMFLGLGFAVSQPVEKAKMNLPTTASLYGMLMTAFYVTIVKHVITYFECMPGPDPLSPHTLQKYRDVKCPSDEHDSALGMMLFGLLVYCIGFFALNCWLAKIAPERWNDTVFRQYTRFFVNRWRPEYYWWGVEVLLRNVIVACSGVVSSDTRVQLLILSAAVVGHSTLVAIYTPWIKDGLNTFEVVACLLLAMVGAFGLIFMSLHTERSILQQFDQEDWVKTAVQERTDGITLYAVFIVVILMMFFVLFVGLIVWCFSALFPGVVQGQLRVSVEEGEKLLKAVKDATNRSDFLLLVEAVITRGTEYDRARLEELLKKLASVGFTQAGAVESAFIMPPRKGAKLGEPVGQKPSVVSA